MKQGEDVTAPQHPCFAYLIAHDRITRQGLPRHVMNGPESLAPKRHYDGGVTCFNYVLKPTVTEAGKPASIPTVLFKPLPAEETIDNVDLPVVETYVGKQLLESLCAPIRFPLYIVLRTYCETTVYPVVVLIWLLKDEQDRGGQDVSS